MSDTQFYPLAVSQVKAETEDTVTVSFSVPEDLQNTFQYKHGQYLTLKFDIQGQDVRRAYSMSSSPLEEDLAVTVKRVAGGLVSNHINDTLKAGDTVEVMPPQGRFFTALDPEQRKTYYLIGAGSGITPLMSILKTVLEEEPLSSVFLLYGSRHDDQIIFNDQLSALQKRYANQLTVEHIISQPRREKPSGVSGWFSKGTLRWQGRTGRINNEELDRFLTEYPERGQAAEYFICGPGQMIDTVEAALKARGVDGQHLHVERFINAGEPIERKAGKMGAKVNVQLRGESITIEVPPKKTILDTLIDQKYDAPYSCTAGACSTCMAKVTKGSVTMDVCYALDDDEVADGYILACQAHPDSDEVDLTFDV